jgi:hypothetical protein
MTWQELAKDIALFVAPVYVPLLVAKFKSIWAVQTDDFWYKVRGCFIAFFTVLPSVVVFIWKNFGDTILTMLGIKKLGVTIARKVKK